jgi:hypothetical protein
VVRHRHGITDDRLQFAQLLVHLPEPGLQLDDPGRPGTLGAEDLDEDGVRLVGPNERRVGRRGAAARLRRCLRQARLDGVQSLQRLRFPPSEDTRHPLVHDIPRYA